MDWSQERLAAETKLGARTIKRAEAGETLTRAAEHAIRMAFEAAGVVFLTEQTNGSARPIAYGVGLEKRD